MYVPSNEKKSPKKRKYYNSEVTIARLADRGITFFPLPEEMECVKTVTMPYQAKNNV